LAAATNIVASAPIISSAAKSTAYDTDIVEPLLASGRLTFSAEAIDEQSSRVRNSSGCAIEWGANTTSTIAPAASTVPTYTRAVIGKSLIQEARTDGGR